jgi:hypothetical protein
MPQTVAVFYPFDVKLTKIRLDGIELIEFFWQFNLLIANFNSIPHRTAQNFPISIRARDRFLSINNQTSTQQQPSDRFLSYQID